MESSKNYKCNQIIQTTEGTYICPYRTRQSSHLNRHLKSHLNNPSFAPSLERKAKPKLFCHRMNSTRDGSTVGCTYSTTNPDCLWKHSMEHDNPENKYKCYLKIVDNDGVECDCNFTTKFHESLKNHVRSRFHGGCSRVREQLLAIPPPIPAFPLTPPPPLALYTAQQSGEINWDDCEIFDALICEEIENYL